MKNVFLVLILFGSLKVMYQMGNVSDVLII
jgi:hypothetical protein